MRWTRLEIAWAAGLLEGEGSFSRYPRRGGSSGYTIKCGMCDKDVVEKLCRVLGVGYVERFQPKDSGHKAQWILRINRLHHVYAVCVAIHEFLGERRRQRVESLLKGMNEELSADELHRLRVEAGRKGIATRNQRATRGGRNRGTRG